MCHSIFIKLITIVVMTSHSLFGCSFHHACNTICAGEVSECKAGCSCQSDCSTEGNEYSCQQHLKQDIASNCCLYSEVGDELSGSGKLPVKAPCQCKCEHTNCAFLHNSTVKISVDGVSQPPATLCLIQPLKLQAVCGISRILAVLHSLRKTGISQCAVTQVWLI